MMEPYGVMLDLETMGQRPGCAIVAIGACLFVRGEVSFTFYRRVSMESNAREGMALDAATVRWWLGQSDAARGELTGCGYELKRTLKDFDEWFRGFDGFECALPIWGCGSDFDNAILAEAYRVCGVAAPWRFWQNRCYRTVKNLFPQVEMERSGTHHNALDDAIDQAKHLMRIHEVWKGAAA